MIAPVLVPKIRSKIFIEAAANETSISLDGSYCLPVTDGSGRDRAS